jgi:hypothetical protein
MLKEHKTKKELEALVRERMGGMVFSHLEVRPEPTYGWGAFVVANPQVVGECQAQADRAARDLRAHFDLKA